MKNWAGNLEYGAARVHVPTSVEELQGIVASSQSAKVVGSRHSFTSIADTKGDHLSLQNFTSIRPVDPQTKTVSVGAGVNYGMLAPVLHAQGYALPNLASLPHISVAGAVATATHGSGVGNGCLSTSVRAVEMVLANGELRRIERGEADFDGVVVGLGALGVVTSLSLDVQPTFDLCQRVYDGVPFSTIEAHFEEIVSSGYSVSLFTSWDESRVFQAWVKDHPERLHNRHFYGGVFADSARHPVPNMPVENCTDQGGVRGAWHERLPHFKLEFTPSGGVELQTEYLMDRHHAVEALQAVQSLSHEIAPLLLISEIRTIAADNLWMSMSNGRESVAIHFTWKQEVEAVSALIPKIEAVLAPFAPRSHWGKLFAMDSERIAESYPRHREFVALANKLDPGGKFRNAFLNEACFSF